MFNSVDAYGGIRRTAALQNVASGQNALTKPTSKPEVKPDENIQTKQPEVLNKAAIKEAVSKLNETVAPALQTVEFAMDEESDRVVVKVIDKATQKVIRQMPNEEVLAFSKTIDKLQGLVIRQTA